MYDKELVLNRWRRDFENLYKFNCDNFDDSFKERKVAEVSRLQSELDDNCTLRLNREIDIQEVKTEWDNAKM